MNQKGACKRIGNSMAEGLNLDRMFVDQLEPLVVSLSGCIEVA